MCVYVWYLLASTAPRQLPWTTGNFADSRIRLCARNYFDYANGAGRGRFGGKDKWHIVTANILLSVREWAIYGGERVLRASVCVCEFVYNIHLFAGRNLHRKATSAPRTRTPYTDTDTDTHTHAQTHAFSKANICKIFAKLHCTRAATTHART